VLQSGHMKLGFSSIKRISQLNQDYFKKHRALLIAIVIFILGIGVVYGAYLGISDYMAVKAAEKQKASDRIALIEQAVAKTQQEVELLNETVTSSLKNSAVENLKLSQTIEAEKKLRLQGESDLKVSLQKDAASRDVSAVISEWRPRIAHVTCRWSSGTIAIGSGLFLGKFGAVYKIETNRHVVYNEDQKTAPGSCSVKLPDDKDVEANELQVTLSASSDSATIYITEPSPKMEAMPSSILPRVCGTRANVGESIVVLGYPAIGSPKDITATEGIISGYEDNYYITSAKIERGNSGGIAVALKSNCIIGMPTLTRIGDIESLGRILDWKYVQVR
jgi:S1-C subfamily serine protease